ncbi:atrial natriuretic peptide receptor 1-like [Littorina saxatilis]|uniref:atrial natriuretic peptide receptor 1-like n=1 Tax=Littorina saxatilis TaxID=31220 RepID=UPI0038B43581
MRVSLPAAAMMTSLVVTSLLVTSLRGALTSSSNTEVKLGVILPYKDLKPWVMPKVLPAIRYAIETVNKRGWLPGKRLVVHTADSQCSETEGPLAAIDMYHKGTANVFLGPACNYAIAPVARFSHRWGIPVLTAGAFVRAFHDKSEYKMLTRILGTYDKSGHFFISLFKEFGWQQAGLLFYERLGPNAGKTECFFAMEGVYEGLKTTFGKTPWIEKFDQRNPETNYKTILQEVPVKARSKWLR